MTSTEQPLVETTIGDDNLSELAGKVVIITGGSSGLGLATTKLLLRLGASVVVGDLEPPAEDHPQARFVRTNVTVWNDLLHLFEETQKMFGRIDHVFANAGIGGRVDYLDEQFGDDGRLLEPTQATYDINLRGCVNTAYLALHHMRRQSPTGGSIVMTASASSFQRFRIVDYAAAKHGVLGFMRGLVPAIAAADLPIRVNVIGPGWTATGLVNAAMVEAAGGTVQSADAAARSAAILMADEARNGQFFYSDGGRYWEIEEQVFLPSVKRIENGGTNLDTVMARMLAALPKKAE